MKILGDFKTNVERALSEIEPKWRGYPGLVVCGSHTPDTRQAEEIIKEIYDVRLGQLPFLGICYGHQLAAIEYARHVMDIKDATSEEWGKGEFVVVKMPELNVGLKDDGESYWNNYAVRDDILHEWQKPDFFITTQFHPEYESSIDRPHPLLVKFLELCKAPPKYNEDDYANL